jgi:RNA polymerase sigma-70 factor (ECF subfamily)
MISATALTRRSATRASGLREATDDELAEALILGRPGASRAILERFSPLVRSIARRIIGPYGEVEDAVQEVYLNLLRSVKGLREPGALRAFVIRITSRTLVHERHRRRSRLYERVPCDDVDTFAAHTNAGLMTTNAWLRLQTLLDRLRARERRVFLLHFAAGMNAAEIANALGVSVPTVRRALRHARQRMATWAQRDPFLVDYFSDARPGLTQILLEEELAPLRDDAAA